MILSARTKFKMAVRGVVVMAAALGQSDRQPTARTTTQTRATSEARVCRPPRWPLRLSHTHFAPSESPKPPKYSIRRWGLCSVGGPKRWHLKVNDRCFHGTTELAVWTAFIKAIDPEVETVR